MRKGFRFAVLAGDRREGHVHALEHVENVGRSLRRVGQHGQHLLALGVQRVLPAAEHILNHVAIGLDGIVRHERVQLLRVHRQNLGVQEGDGRLQRRQQRDGARLHLLTLRVAVVAGLAQEGVAIQLLHVLHGGVNFAQALGEGFDGLAQRAGNRVQRSDLLGGRLHHGFPFVFRLKNRREIPCKSGIHLRSVFQFHLRHPPCSMDGSTFKV